MFVFIFRFFSIASIKIPEHITNQLPTMDTAVLFHKIQGACKAPDMAFVSP